LNDKESEANMYLIVDDLAIISMTAKQINALVVNAISDDNTAIDVDWQAYI
jgi:hypothetical protein